MLAQNATARFIGSGSVALVIPASPKNCFESAFIVPMILEASSDLISN